MECNGIKINEIQTGAQCFVVLELLWLCWFTLYLYLKWMGLGKYSLMRAISNIMIKYHHLTPRLDDMMDELHGSCTLSKIVLKS